MTIICTRDDQVTNVSPEGLKEMLGSRPVYQKHLNQAVPSFFEKNMGQTNTAVKYLSRGKDHVLFLTSDKAVLMLSGSRKQEEISRAAGPRRIPFQESLHLSIETLGIDTGNMMIGINELPGKSNYLIGIDPDYWQKNIPHFEMVKYHHLYQGIDLVYHSRKGNLEYDFIVAPGADPDQIRLKISGA